MLNSGNFIFGFQVFSIGYGSGRKSVEFVGMNIFRRQ